MLSNHSGVKLEADLVDDAEANQYGQRKADTDREKIDVDRQPVRDAGNVRCGSLLGLP